MFRLQCQGSAALAAVLVVLLSARADAQISNDPGPPREPGGLVNNLLTGVQYDIVNQAKAERRLYQVQSRIRRNAERGHAGAVEHDARKIDNLRYRIAVDEWLIRKNSLCDPGNYPFRTDACTYAAIMQAGSPR